MYEKEVIEYITKFKAKYQEIKAEPGAWNDEFAAYASFLSHLTMRRALTDRLPFQISFSLVTLNHHPNARSTLK